MKSRPSGQHRKLAGKQGGFTLFELIVVVVVIGILAASGLRYYNQAMDDARRTGLEILAHRFTAATALVHGQWIIETSAGRAQRAGDGWRVEIEEIPLYLNAQGWPANTDGGSTGASNQTAEECHQVWQALLQNPALATVGGKTEPESARGQRRYHISSVDGHSCRYELITPDNRPHYFEYRLATGQVKIEVPPME